jgi:formylglycine-generating enzyme required for sulfatase activity
MADRPSHWRSHLDKVRLAESDRFTDLVALGGLDPATDLQGQELSGVIFAGCDLRRYNFSRARLVGCDFTDAAISGACFDQAEIDRAKAGPLNQTRTDLRQAKDWLEYALHWHRQEQVLSAEHLPVGATFRDSPISPEMVVIRPGSFLMGSPDGRGGDRGDIAEVGRRGDEGPRHHVTIARKFAVGRFPVTRTEWAWAMRGDLATTLKDRFALAHTTIARSQSLGKPWLLSDGNYPVTDISWYEATAYTHYLSEVTGCSYRLLSETEWEYSCRGGTSTRYATGDHISMSQARYNAAGAVAVGSYSANDFGLFDMHGNVREWCQDIWHSNYVDAPDDGSAWLVERGDSAKAGGSGRYRHDDPQRVIRGGGWSHNENLLRSASRRGLHPSFGSPRRGFRVARALT